MKFKLLACLVFWNMFSACGLAAENGESESPAFLRGGGWDLSQSPYLLPPYATIAICDRGVKAGVKDYVKDAVRTWLKAGKRDDMMNIIESCSQGDRIIELQRVPDSVPYYGQVSPLQGKTYVVSVPDKWAGHWTANHEVGHIFGFAHIFDHTLSIMNSEDNGRYMNGGELAPYDYEQVTRILSLNSFVRMSQVWDDTRLRAREETRRHQAPRDEPGSGSCLGANGVTVYADGTVTTYRGDTYTCSGGRWNFSAGLPES